jgi:hypothetical protein
MRVLVFALSWFAVSIPASLAVGRMFARQVPAVVPVRSQTRQR